jgi:beta-lactamase class A
MNEKRLFFSPGQIFTGSLLLAVCFFYTGVFYQHNEDLEYLQRFKPVRLNDTAFSYINPLVGTDSPIAFSAGFYKDMERKIKARIKASKGLGMEDAAVYYRDLNSAVWFGVNPTEDFFPASLLKMTYAFAAYKQEEKEPGFLSKKATYTTAVSNELLNEVGADRRTTLVVGKSYTMAELLTIMLTVSDNGAKLLLEKNTKPEFIEGVYSALKIPSPDLSHAFEISVEKYALFFRMLYSATFINDQHSEEFLRTLTRTNFRAGIRRFLPDHIAVAHKHGVYNLPKDERGHQIHELHDCGIVYAKLEAPYLVCIMTKGPDQQVLADFIAAVSNDIYIFTTRK